MLADMASGTSGDEYDPKSEYMPPTGCIGVLVKNSYAMVSYMPSQGVSECGR